LNTRLRLPREFYARTPDIVARDLLGQRLVRIWEGQTLSGVIVEAEAYTGDDAASHAYRGPTSRCAPMFGPPGRTYVYFIYGMHWMFNIAAHDETGPGAVLIRALEPRQGITAMQELRGGKLARLLTNGPARLAQALAIDGTLNDVDLCTHPQIMLLPGTISPADIACGPRLRVPGDAVAKSRPWRFWIRGNRYLSK